jgi:hypothetical protein
MAVAGENVIRTFIVHLTYTPSTVLLKNPASLNEACTQDYRSALTARHFMTSLEANAAGLPRSDPSSVSSPCHK